MFLCQPQGGWSEFGVVAVITSWLALFSPSSYYSFLLFTSFVFSSSAGLPFFYKVTLLISTKKRNPVMRSSALITLLSAVSLSFVAADSHRNSRHSDVARRISSDIVKRGDFCQGQFTYFNDGMLVESPALVPISLNTNNIHTTGAHAGRKADRVTSLSP